MKTRVDVDPLVSLKPLIMSREFADVEACVKLLAFIVYGLELAVGRQTAGMLASMMGREYYKMVSPGGGLLEALKSVSGGSFRFELRRFMGRVVHEDSGGKHFYIVGRECPIRQVLYHEDLPAGSTLCRIMSSFVEQLFADKLGGRYRLEFVRAGPNACLCRVRVLSGNVPSEDTVFIPSKPSLEEYVEALRRDYSLLLKAFDRVVERVLGGNPATSYLAGKRYGVVDGLDLLTYLGRRVSLEDAIKVLNRAYPGILSVKLTGNTLEVSKSFFHQLVSQLGLGKPLFIYRSLQGYIAGVLEALTGLRIDLQALDPESRRLRVYAR